MKTGFSPSEVGGIACCDRKMSSASSLSPYQAVCCTELSPLALGTGHTSCHPPPRLSFSLSSSVSLSLSLSFLPGCSDPPFLTTLPPFSVTLRRSASIVSVRTGGLSVDKAAGLQKTHQTLSLLCAARELSAQQKDRHSSFSLRPLLVSTTWPQTGKRPWRVLYVSRVTNTSWISSNRSRRDPCFLTVVMTVLWWMIVNIKHKSRLRVDAIMTHAL